jgi:hypothetical protein
MKIEKYKNNNNVRDWTKNVYNADMCNVCNGPIFRHIYVHKPGLKHNAGIDTNNLCMYT